MAKVIGAAASLAALFYLGFYLAVRPTFGAFAGFVVLACAALPLLVPAQRGRGLGRLAWMGAAALAALSFALADRDAHSVSDTLISFLPLLGLIVSAAWRIAGGTAPAA